MLLKMVPGLEERIKDGDWDEVAGVVCDSIPSKEMPHPGLEEHIKDGDWDEVAGVVCDSIPSKEMPRNEILLVPSSELFSYSTVSTT
jgi:hypothetical protein